MCVYRVCTNRQRQLKGYHQHRWRSILLPNAYLRRRHDLGLESQTMQTDIHAAPGADRESDAVLSTLFPHDTNHNSADASHGKADSDLSNHHQPIHISQSRATGTGASNTVSGYRTIGSGEGVNKLPPPECICLTSLTNPY